MVSNSLESPKPGNMFRRDLEARSAHRRVHERSHAFLFCEDGLIAQFDGRLRAESRFSLAGIF